MNKFFKFTVIIFALFLLTLPLTGCLDGTSTLVLYVDNPANDTSVNTPTVTVNGRVAGTESATAKLTVNSEDVKIKDGKFLAEVKLTEGKNVINIGATAGSVNLKEQVTVTYAPTK